MTRNDKWLEVAAAIRTIAFLFAMIPLVAAMGFLCLASLVMISPLVLYARLTGRLLKDPWKKRRLTLD